MEWKEITTPLIISEKMKIPAIIFFGIIFIICISLFISLILLLFFIDNGTSDKEDVGECLMCNNESCDECEKVKN